MSALAGVIRTVAMNAGSLSSSPSQRRSPLWVILSGEVSLDGCGRRIRPWPRQVT